MKTKIIHFSTLIMMLSHLSSLALSAEEGGEVIIRLKDGSIVNGTIIGPETADPITVRTGEGLVVEIYIGDIERIIVEEPSRPLSGAERKSNGEILMVAGVVSTVMGFVFRTEPELRHSGLGFPNTLLLASGILGVSGLYLYLTADENGKGTLKDETLFHEIESEL